MSLPNKFSQEETIIVIKYYQLFIFLLKFYTSIGSCIKRSEYGLDILVDVSSDNRRTNSLCFIEQVSCSPAEDQLISQFILQMKRRTGCRTKTLWSHIQWFHQHDHPFQKQGVPKDRQSMFVALLHHGISLAPSHGYFGSFHEHQLMVKKHWHRINEMHFHFCPH